MKRGKFVGNDFVELYLGFGSRGESRIESERQGCSGVGEEMREVENVRKV